VDEFQRMHPDAKINHNFMLLIGEMILDIIKLQSSEKKFTCVNTSFLILLKFYMSFAAAVHK